MRTYFRSKDASFLHQPTLFGAIAIAILASQLALIWTHVPWHDELQAVLLARDTNTLSAWYVNFRYEGHPPLWHLLLKLMLVAFDEPTALRAATSIAALTTAWLIYFRSPFANWVKLALALNYFIFFEYAVIARGYCLGVVFMFAAIAYRAHPISWLFAALIPQAGAQMIFFPGVFAAIMFDEKRWSWPGAALCALGAVLAAAWMKPAPDVETLTMLIRHNMSLQERALRTLISAGDTVLPLSMDGSLVAWNEKLETTALAPLIGVAIPAIVYSFMRTQPLTAAATALFTLLTYAFSIFGSELNLRHFGFIVITVIVGQWITVEKGAGLNRIAAAWFAILAISGLGAALDAVKTPFSPSRAMADHVARTIEPDRLLIAIDTLVGVEITAFTGRPSYNVTNSCMQTFVAWKGPVFEIPTAEGFAVDTLAAKRKALDVMKAAAARAGGRALLILDKWMGENLHWIAEDPSLHYDSYFHVDGKMVRYLYRLDVLADPDTTPIPPCARE